MEGPGPSEAPGKEMEDWKPREDGQMQTLNLKPETKEKDITEHTKALRKPLLSEGWLDSGTGQHTGEAEKGHLCHRQ